MGIRRMAAVQSGLLLVAMFANAASRNNMMRITILESATQALPLSDNGVPRDCDQVTFDAYCRSTRNAPLLNTLLVQVGDEPPFRVSCTIESRFSRCAPLPRGESFDARREKKGITIYYVDDKGKERKEFYAFGDAGGKTVQPKAAIATRSASVARVASVAPAPVTTPLPSRSASVARENPPVAPVSAQNSASPPGSALVQGTTEKVRCNFTSTPAGAEITIDGKFVGNTPSVVGLITGTHNVVLSLPGFATWKRELTVMSDSELNVNTALQRQK